MKNILLIVLLAILIPDKEIKANSYLMKANSLFVMKCQNADTAQKRPLKTIAQHPNKKFTNDKLTDNLQDVDPRIGNVGWMLVPTRPTVQQPNQLIRMYPERNDDLDDQITEFPLTVAAHRNGNLFGIMAASGMIPSTGKPISAWDHELEITTPYFYSTWLEDYDVTAQFTPGKKAGFFRFIFPKEKEKQIFISNPGKNTWKQTSGMVFKNEETFNGVKAWVVGQFKNTNKTKPNNQPSQTIKDNGLWLSWNTPEADTIEFKYAISYISSEQAERSLNSEIPNWDFKLLTQQAKASWAKELSKIQVEGGTQAQRRSFYTALYRCYERMVNISEEGKYYSGYDNRVHTDQQDFYTDDWSWDTYLAHHPLRCILNPDREGDILSSYVKMYEQSGWIPTFPQVYGDSPCMNGFHSSISLLDGWRKGIRNFDSAKAYEGMLKNTLQATMVPWKNGPACSLDSFYYQKGYFPALRPGEKETEPVVTQGEKRQSVAVSLGAAYDSWAVGQMAKDLGKTNDTARLNKMAQNYKLLYWPEKGFFMPKDKDGNWIDINPAWDGGMGGRDYYDENNGWTYLWQVQHDIKGLIGLIGGKEKFESRLDQLFREPIGMSKYQFWAKFPDASGLIGQFSMGNEPSFSIPYLYNFTNSPWKTQKKIRLILDTWYKDNIFGIPGDEDGGGMSAFVVFSSMGFYPITPGSPYYTIGSPLFSKVSIHLENGKVFTLIAKNCSVKNKYIQAAKLNGKPLQSTLFSHTDLMNGGLLELEMGALPNRTWGTER